MGEFTYRDEAVIHKGRTFYLRTKWGRKGSICSLSIRTHKGGKGTKMAEVKGVISEKKTIIEMIHKLSRKFSFQYIRIEDIPPIPKE